MNCARENCGHAESLHVPSEVENELPGQCWGCSCPAFIVTPAPPARKRDDEPTKNFDTSDNEGDPI